MTTPRIRRPQQGQQGRFMTTCCMGYAKVATRMRLYKDAKGEKEVTWGEVLRKTRVPEVHPTTAADRGTCVGGMDSVVEY